MVDGVPQILKLVGLLLASTLLLFAIPEAKASEICENIVVGETSAPIIAYGQNNVPIYGSPQPIYQEDCHWKYGTVAVDPLSRRFVAGWNYDDIEAAKNYANSACGTHCAIISFGEDFAYVALSDDDRVSGFSTRSSAEAENQCRMAGGVDCATVVSASSTADAVYWHFGSVAYDSTTNVHGNSWALARRSDAEKSALKNCAQPGCWAYTFQTGYGGIAMADDGSLYGAWSTRGEESAGKVAVKNCEKAKGQKSCSIVATGSALSEPRYKPKPLKQKKLKSEN